MTELEYRSMFVSLRPDRDVIALGRNWSSWFPVIFAMRALEGDLERGVYETTEGAVMLVEAKS